MFRKHSQESVLCPPKERYGLAFLLAFLAACALFVPYMIQDQGFFLFYGDFNVQQIPFYKLAHQAVKEGNVFWNFGTDLGVNFIGSYSFYLLGSPFFWLTLPFPTHLVPYLIGPLLILKFSFASLAAYAYITRFVNNKHYAVLGGLLYAFSGFSVYNIFFNHFHEAIIYFPLLLLTLEWFMHRKRYIPYILAVAFSCIANYYFFFGMVIFVVLYFIVRTLSGEWDLFCRLTNLKRDLGRFGFLALASVLGVALSAFLLLPSALAITSNTRIDSYLTGWSGLVYDRSQIYSYIVQCFFFPPDLPARPIFFPGADVKWSSMAGWMPVFGMTGVIAWMSAHRRSWQKKLMVICGVIAFVPILNSTFSLFNYNYYARWFYMPILIMALMTAKGLEDRQVNFMKGWRWTAGITLAIGLAIGFFPQGQDADGNFTGFGLYTQDSDNAAVSAIYKERFYITCAIAIVSLVVLLFMLLIKKRWNKEFTFTAIAVVLIVSVVYSSYFVGQGRGINGYDYIIPRLLQKQQAISLENAKGERLPTEQIDDLRIDVYEADSALDNTAMFLGISGIHAFHSIVPGSVMEFYDYVGVGRSVATRAKTEQYALRGLLSVKYLLDDTSDGEHFEDEYYITQMPGWSVYTGGQGDPGALRDESVQNGYYIYQNDYFIPYGFTYDYYMTKEYLDTYPQDNRADLMLKAMVLDEQQIQQYGNWMSDLEDTGLDYNRELSYSFYYNNCTERAATACTDFSVDNHGFTATAKLEKNNLVFFSIPYDEGWLATVDGKPVAIEKVNVGFMAVPVSGDGQAHTIRFTYKTPGLFTGLWISLGALIATLLLAILLWLYRKKHPLTEEMPCACDEESVMMTDEWMLATPAEECDVNAPPADGEHPLLEEPEIPMPEEE